MHSTSARREMLKETGYTADKLTALTALTLKEDLAADGEPPELWTTYFFGAPAKELVYSTQVRESHRDARPAHC